MSKTKFILDIKGMHCRSCEILLDSNIGKVKGVCKVRTSHKKGIAEIECDREPDYSQLEKAVNDAGYALGKEEKKHFFSRNIGDYMELASVASILFVGYVVLKAFGVTDLNLNPSGLSGLIGVLIVGLTAGISTCMALIGGLVLGMSSRHAEMHPEATVTQKFRPHVFFNLGRLISYAVLGGFIGLIGSVLKPSSSLLGMITIALGIVMLFLGFKLIEIFPRMRNKTIVLPKGISKIFGLHSEMKEYSHRGSFITGALTFFVPCGFTQAMQLYAVSTGSFVQGSLIMGMFALGTLPGIIGIGGLTSVIKGTFARYFFKFAGLVVILLAVFNIRSGWNLAGFTFAANVDEKPEIVRPIPAGPVAGPVTDENNLVDKTEGDEKQIIEMVQSSRGYSPRQFTIKKGVPVVWKIQSTNQYSCAAYISVPSLGISEALTLGENVIEFTPTKAGQIRFTCSMGMYSGSFNVTN